MFEFLRKKINNFRRDNEGSAIVLVIVALAMVGILAMTIMWMSMTNYYMKATDKGNKMGFYSSETILEQIKAGLEGDASWAASRAYAYILTKDYSAASAADRDYEFKREYQRYFVERVADPSDASKGTYSLSHLLEFVDPAAGVTLTLPSSGRIRYLHSADPKFIHSYSSNLMKLEGIHLEYTQDDVYGSEYVSVIDTDIIVMVPDVSFTQTSVLPDVFEYALVANKKLSISNSGIGTTINGNIYAGCDGIDLLNKLTIKYPKQMEGRLISKGNVRIGMDPMSLSGTELKIEAPDLGGKSEFWAGDIVVGNGAKLTTNKVDSYIADDLTLSGRKAKVEMKGNGNYYGYGSSDSVAGESSAIVVNGLGSQVDVKGLDKVMLLGRTFVSIPNQTISGLEPYGITPIVSVNSIDFAMGESLAVKGEQVAFLVPDECLTYVDTSVSGNSVRMPNPFVKTAYETVDADGDGVLDHEIEVNLSSLSAYLNPATGYNIVYPYGSQLGYVYMQMSGEKANEYYEAYYKNNLEKLNNYFLVYAGKDASGKGKIELPAGSNLESEGNLLSALKDDTSVEQDTAIIKNSDSQLYKAIPESEKATITADLKQKKEFLCAKLVKEGVTTAELSNDLENPHNPKDPLFDNLILRDEVENLISLNSSNPYEFVETEENKYKAVFAKNDSGTPYNYTDSDIRVLVVIGDVNITTDFTGLLIASGKITVEGEHTITSIVNADDDSMQQLKNSLQVKKSVKYNTADPTAEEERSALQYFRDGSGYDLDGLSGSGSSVVSRNNVDFTELVKFNNWVKK